jgi:putative transposase
VTVGASSYKGFRYSVEIISHCVWLYHRFPLSLREVQEMMLALGITVSNETVRPWCAKFGQTYANSLRRRRPLPGDKWHLDEVFIKIRGKTHYLWRAVDQHGNVLDILVTCRRDTRAATRFFRKLFKGLEYVPRVLVTDKLRSYGAARHRVLRSVKHHQSKYLNNRAENSHQPTRQTGTSDEEVHLRQARPAVPVRLQRHLPTLSAPSSPAICRGVPPRNDRPIHHLEPDHRHGHGGLKQVGDRGTTDQTMLIL